MTELFIPPEKTPALHMRQAAGLDKQLAHELVSEQARQTPDAIALVYDDHSLSYAELEERSNQLAHTLQQMGIGPERLVGLFLDRSLEMVIGLLAVLKAGGAYVPLDPTYPPMRVSIRATISSRSVWPWPGTMAWP